MNQVHEVLPSTNIAQHNREIIKPFVDTFTENLYRAFDKAAEKGVVLKEGISPETAEQIIAQVLFSIQANYQGNVYEDRNIFENTAYMLGNVIGYPTEIVATVMRKLPFAKHFIAGMNNGKVKANQHLVTLYLKVHSVGDKISSYLPTAGGKTQVTTATPTTGILQPTPA